LRRSSFSLVFKGLFAFTGIVVLGLAVVKVSCEKPVTLVNPEAGWPEPLRMFWESELIHATDGLDYSLYRANEVEYCLIIRTNERSCDSLVDSMRRRWSLLNVRRGNDVIMQFMRSCPSEWTGLDKSQLVEFYVSPAWLAGDEGHLYVVAKDSQSKTIVLWYYFNF